MLLVASNTKTLPADRWIHTTGERRGLVLVKEWDIPLWDSDAAAENVPAGIVRMRSQGLVKCFRLVGATVLLFFPRGVVWHFHPVRAKTRGKEILDSEKEKSPVRLEITTDKDEPGKKREKKEVEEVFITKPKYHNYQFPGIAWTHVRKSCPKGSPKRREKHPYPKRRESHELVYICRYILCVLTRLKLGLVPD